jgi:hypothetical protein
MLSNFLFQRVLYIMLHSGPKSTTEIRIRHFEFFSHRIRL